MIPSPHGEGDVFEFLYTMVRVVMLIMGMGMVLSVIDEL